MKIYITTKTDFDNGKDEILAVFRNYEEAKNSCIDNANLQTVNSDLHCEVIDEREGEYFSIGVYWPEDENYVDDDPGMKSYFTVFTREVIN